MTNRRNVARWARATIATGHPGFELKPVVVAFNDVPRIIDPAEASKLPELAVLSAMAHPQLDVTAAAIHAIADLPEEEQKLYMDVILSKLPGSARQTLEARMKGYVYQSDFARKYYGEGLEKGRVEGLEKGRVEGRVEGFRASARELARARLKRMPDSARTVIDALDSEAKLIALIAALAAAQSAADVRAALKAAAGA